MRMLFAVWVFSIPTIGAEIKGYPFDAQGTSGFDQTAYAVAMNNNGTLVGDFYLPGGTVVLAFDTQSGGLCPPPRCDHATGINDNNQVIGTGSLGGFLYSGGSVRSLPGIIPQGINDSGVIVGTAINGHAAEDVNGQVIDLDPTSDSDAVAINALGQIVGMSGGQAVLYSNGQKRILPSLGTGYTTSYATAINNSGEIVGYASDPTAGITSAFLYTNGQMLNIGALGGPYHVAINDEGEIVGTSNNGGFVYVDGHVISLSSIWPTNSGWSEMSPVAINNEGQIAGTGFVERKNSILAWVLSDAIPTPEPATILLFGIGLLGVVTYIRHKIMISRRILRVWFRGPERARSHLQARSRFTFSGSLCTKCADAPGATRITPVFTK